MPNWCENTLFVSGDKNQIEKFKKQAKGEETALSFANFISMPKELEGIGSPPDIVLEKEYGEAVKEAKKLAKEDPRFGLSLPITKKMKKDYTKRFGALNWYDWQIKHWGTKWDVDASLNSENENELVYSFDSAWSPPGAWLRKVSELFLNLKFKLEYDEPGMGFKGVMEATAGKLTDTCLNH